MSRIRATLVVALILALIGLVQAPVYAQSATSGLVTGTVLDASNAAVSGATVSLEAKERAITQTTTTGAAGTYTFSTVPPGTYSLSATAKGFEKSVVSSLEVQVLRSYTVNFTLQVGAATMTVEVKAGAVSELETTGSTVGATLGGEALEHLPTYTRSASALMFLQPAVTPPDVSYQTMAPSDNIGGSIAGSRAEQITFLLDGGDVTSDLEGTNNYNSPPHEPQPAPIVPIPQEQTQEFRMAVSNPNGTFDRSSGGEVAVLTKSGSNAWHGEGYEYNNNDGFNANSWTLNEGMISKPHEVDNRFGGNVGGPIFKNKLWFFAGYEGRRFYENATDSRVVPTASLAAGQLVFPDATGVNRTYNLNLTKGALAADCGTAGTAACDPRGIGISPAILGYFALYPAPSAGAAGQTCGDLLNTACYVFAAATPFLQDLGVLRLDWNISNKWTAFFTFHTADARRTGTEQALISATAPASFVSTDPYYPNFWSFQLTGQITPNLTLVSHGSYLRNWWGWGRIDPGTYNLPNLSETLELAGESTSSSGTEAPSKFLADPLNTNTQQARNRVWDGRDIYMAEDFSWSHGAHLWQFGAYFYRWDDIHVRTDDVIGGLTNYPVAHVQAMGLAQGALANTVGPNYEPPACPAGSTTATFCLPGGDAESWDVLYSSILGIVDHSSQVATFNSNFQPNALGSTLSDNVTMYSPYGYIQDVWKVKPSITVTLGLDWGVQLNPSEAHNLEAVLTSAETGAAINMFQYLSARANILGAGIMPGTAFNPQFSLTPVSDVPSPFTGEFKRNIFHDFGPRFSVAWNVPGHTWLFGDKKTVVRAGYSLLWDRTSAVSEALSPLLAGGLASVETCTGPVPITPATPATVGKVGTTANPNATCTGAATNPMTAYRIGVDGPTAPIPLPITAEPIPYVFQNQFLVGPYDPYAVPGRAHNVNFDVQRSLPWNLVLELGYIGKFSRNLPQGLALNDTYYKSKDALSGHTLVQDWQAVAAAVQQGKPVPTEPWFEDMIGGGGAGAAAKCVGIATTLALTGVTNCSTLVATADPVDLAFGGLGDWAVSADGAGLNSLLPLAGFPQMDDQQVNPYFNATSDKGYSNYNAFFVTLNKAVSANLQFQFNWTWSKAIGTQGIGQQYLYAGSTPYNLAVDYGPETFDHQHVINLLFVYNAPFGKGQRYKTGNDFMDRYVLGGWTVSGIYSFYTGIPLDVNCGSNFGTAFAQLGIGMPCDSTLNLSSLAGDHSHVAAGMASGPNFIINSGPAGGGTGKNIFANPAAVISSLSPVNLATTGQVAWGDVRMIPSWNVDFAVAKAFPITERVKFEINAQFLNIFNHVLFNYPSLYVPAFIGQVMGEFTSQINAPRNILLGARILF